MMKSTIFSTATSVALSLPALFFIMSDAWADTYYLSGSRAGKSAQHYEEFKDSKAFDAFNKRYGGTVVNLQYAYGPRGIIGVKDDITYRAHLVGDKKRYSVFKVQVEKKDESTGNVVTKELVLKSGKEVSDFCADLRTTTNSTHRYDFASTSLYSYAYWQIEKETIAVAYEIAYDKDSKLAEDGKNSTPGITYAFCPGPWNWAPDKAHEKEDRGISEVKFTDPDSYEVTCVNTKTPKAIFKLDSKTIGESHWSNGALKLDFTVTSETPTLHQLNEQVGAKYCPM